MRRPGGRRVARAAGHGGGRRCRGCVHGGRGPRAADHRRSGGPGILTLTRLVDVFPVHATVAEAAGHYRRVPVLPRRRSLASWPRAAMRSGARALVRERRQLRNGGRCQRGNTNGQHDHRRPAEKHDDATAQGARVAGRGFTADVRYGAGDQDGTDAARLQQRRQRTATGEERAGGGLLAAAGT